MAEGDYNVRAIISAETSRFEKGMKTAQKSVDTLSSTINTLQSTISKVFAFAGISIGVNTFVNALKSIDTEASESNKQLKLLSNTVKITGAATWTSAKQMNELAESISKNTNYSVNDIRKMETVLLGFKNITGETFTEASNAITDMATVMGMDLTSAVQTVGKALDDPIKGLDSLRRQGFAFTDEQKKELEQLVKNGKQMQAQKIILDELATTYGGAAKQAADSGKQLENNIKNLKAELGKSWDGSIEPIKKAANVLIERWTEAIKKMNEANAAAKNLKIVLSSAGETGDVSDAKTLQAAKNVQLQQEYRDLFKFEEIAKKSAKERTKTEQQMYKELSQIYDVYIQSYQSQGYTYLEAIKKVQEDKKAEWTQGLNDFQMIVEKEKQLEKEREEAEKAAADEEAIARRKALTDAYDETIAKAKEEIKIRKSMGEKISEEAEQTKLLEVMKSAYLKMIEDSNGEMKEEAVRLQAIIDLQKKLEKTTNDSFKVINADWNDFEQAVINIYGEIEEEASSWTDFFEDSFKTFGKFGQQAIEGIGEALVNGGSAWENMGATALEMIAQILEALAAELAALVAVNYATWSFDKSATAAAGAAAALVAAGTLKGVASNMKKVSNAAKEANGNLDAFRKLLKEIYTQATSGGVVNLADSFSGFQEAINTAEGNVLTSLEAFNKAKDYLEDIEKQYKSLQDRYIEWILTGRKTPSINTHVLDIELRIAKYDYNKTKGEYEEAIKQLTAANKAYNDSIIEVTENTKKEIASTKINTVALLDLYKASTTRIFSLMHGEIYKSITEQVSSIVSNLVNIGTDIGSKFVDGIVDGVSSKDFAIQLRDYVRSNLIKLAVYTEEFQVNLASATRRLLQGIVTNSYGTIKSATDELKTMYSEAIKTANEVDALMTKVFGDIETNTESAYDFQFNKIKSEFESLIADLKESAGDVGQTIVSSISEGMDSVDFASQIKSYLKQNFIKVTLYSKYAEELSKLGESISNAILSDSSEKKIKTLKSELESLYKNMTKETKVFSNVLDSVFGKDGTVESGLENLEDNLTKFEKAIEDLQKSISDLGGDVATNLVNSLSEGLGQSDFLSTMKNFIKKMLVQTMVYTESMKAEIEAIGKAISDGLTKGFTETSIHKIRRDLSYVFDQANKTVSQIDDVLNKVFDVSGYATGTQNATKGLHLVGEAGPELVRFRGGEQVINAGNTQKALSDTGRTNNFNVTFNNLQDTSAFAMIQQFKDYQRQLAIDGVF